MAGNIGSDDMSVNDSIPIMHVRGVAFCDVTIKAVATLVETQGATAFVFLTPSCALPLAFNSVNLKSNGRFGLKRVNALVVMTE